MPITVLYYDREGCSALSASSTQSADEDEAATRMICVSTRTEFCSEIDKGQANLIVIAESVEWAWREAVQYLDQHMPEAPRLLLLDREDASIRREALLLGIWQTVPRDQVDVLRAVIRLHTRQAVSLLVCDATREALGMAELVLQKNQKSIALGVLLGSIAHEVNNPLEGLGNLLYLARRSRGNEEYVQACLDMAEAELNRVSEITKQMLSFHRDSVVPQEVCLSELLDGILILFAAKLRERQIDVVRQFDCPGWMVAHPGELRQAFVNLVANAVDAMPEGGRLTLRVRERSGKVPLVCITVADSGQGMTREFLKRFGELFATTKGASGTGLGGWVTCRVVKKFGGDLKLYSSQRPGRSGTVISLCFPHARISGNTFRRPRRQRSDDTSQTHQSGTHLRSA